MADIKVSDLPAQTVITDDDLFLLIDRPDSAPKSYKISASVIKEYIGGSELVTDTNVITAAENGKTFFLNVAGGFTSTLPAPELGLRYQFFVRIAPTTAYVITTNGGSNIMYGTYIDTVGEMTYFSAQDTINFVANTSVIGDRLEVYSDGLYWYCTGFSGANGGITTSVT